LSGCAHTVGYMKNTDTPTISPETPAQLVDGLVQRRLRLGLTQAQLALRMGVTPQHVSKLESGSQDVRLTTLLNWASALDAVPALTDWDGRRSVGFGRYLDTTPVMLDVADMVGGVIVTGATGSGSSEYARLLLGLLRQCGASTTVIDPGHRPADGEILALSNFTVTDDADWPEPGAEVRWVSCAGADRALDAIDGLITKVEADREFFSRLRPPRIHAVLLDATRTLIGDRLPVERLDDLLARATRAGIVVLLSYRHPDVFAGDVLGLFAVTSMQMSLFRSSDEHTEQLAASFSTDQMTVTGADLSHMDAGRAFLRRVMPDSTAVTERIKLVAPVSR